MHDADDFSDVSQISTVYIHDVDHSFVVYEKDTETSHKYDE